MDCFEGLLRDKTCSARIPLRTERIVRALSTGRTLCRRPARRPTGTVPAIAKAAGVSVSSMPRVWLDDLNRSSADSNYRAPSVPRPSHTRPTCAAELHLRSSSDGYSELLSRGDDPPRQNRPNHVRPGLRHMLNIEVVWHTIVSHQLTSEIRAKDIKYPHRLRAHFV